jgi:hypothetical protein
MPDTVTDKAVQGYIPVYAQLAVALGPAARVCELGVLDGASLLLWQRLFPEGQVTGVDNLINATWPPGTRKVLMNACDPRLPGELGGPFDLIVDDASHQGTATEVTFGRLWPLVAPGGVYVIEDWYIGLPEYREHPMHNEPMLVTVQSKLRLLGTLDGECEQVTYRFGLCMIHKRRDEREVKTHG